MELMRQGHGICPEAAREMLMAISRWSTIPDALPAGPAESSSKDSCSGGNIAIRSAGELDGGSSSAEECRSKLMSISYARPKDAKPSPPPLDSLACGPFNWCQYHVVKLDGGVGGAAREYYRSKLISISLYDPEESPDVHF